MLAKLVSPGFARILDEIDKGLERGRLLAHLPDGTTRTFGGRAAGFEAEIWLHDWRALLRLATNGTIGWYHAFEAREFETRDLVSLFAVFSDNVRSLGNIARSSGPFRLVAALAHRLNRNSREGSERNIAAHYDLGNDFYTSWLDEGLAYSSGLGFEDLEADDPETALARAQSAKNKAIIKRLGDTQHVLEIGCGWGGLAEEMHAQGANVTAISLSAHQLRYARAHRSPEIEFRCQDYRDVGRDAPPQYDGIACVEMVEALGREYWGAFMDCLARNLKPGGRAAIQYIALAEDIYEDYARTADFIQAYIFPGGLLIKTSEFRALAEERGLQWCDQRGFGADYATTLRLWRARFDEAAARGALPDGFDETFVRLWQFYLAYCEAGFLVGNINVHQVTLIRQ